MTLRRPLLCLLGACLALPGGAADANLDEAIRQASLEFAHKLESATAELNRTRETIAAAEAPLAREAQALRDRIVALEDELALLEAGQLNASENLTAQRRDVDGLKRNLNYVTSQGGDALKSLLDSILPGEAQPLAGRLDPLQQRFGDAATPPAPAAALDVFDLYTDHLARAIGGYRAPGRSLVGADNRVRAGTFVFLGPEVFFQTDEGDARGTVRARAGEGLFPVTHPLPGWAAGAPLFQGQAATVLSDSSGGKALRLREIRGTVATHIHKGGPVAYVIVAVGLLSLVIVLQKVLDAFRLKVDEPARVREFLQHLAAGRTGEARALLPSLQATTREVFTTGLQHVAKPKAALEEHLLAQLQQLHLFFERRLPLLTVIATAAPLLGLLGTVMGMVKTFALITVFGTGNAAKLSSGISEVLVATELGLAVAIPTLVAHGFLSHRIQKKLAQLERHASEFVAAAEEARGTPP